MKIFILFVQRVEKYPGEYGPEALEVAGEFQIEENEELQATLMAKHAPLVGKEYAALRWMVFSVDANEIYSLLMNDPTIKARLVS